ncbi:putative GNAT superfamily acetyltransferase [Bacillus pakistanensis]|uniref:GNAT superfamily acetyltransferase n=1 Tax=Rossellomorea pakistanensis TaxID=992288 RepID=A0ABS2NB95_9BACI|nr:GNAT family N-acetyltransferase [Bacillus pakistanensis]MBM7585125.1 putative GNAT superfamily acetyltransferase [Bacillus pakistanensis]
MRESNNIKFIELDSNDLTTTLLKTFNRYQETNQVLFKANDQYRFKADHFVDQWEDEKKALVIQSLQNCVKSGGGVIGAFLEGRLVGFASVEGELFGSDNEYLELSYIHVSNEIRNSGLGKELFGLCCSKAKQLGAKKLYIAAHPSEETQHFYSAVGCTFAMEINQEIYVKEPLDIQLEFTL